MGAPRGRGRILIVFVDPALYESPSEPVVGHAWICQTDGRNHTSSTTGILVDCTAPSSGVMPSGEELPADSSSTPLVLASAPYDSMLRYVHFTVVLPSEPGFVGLDPYT